METPKIFESEYRFCQILWAHEPVKSRELVALCAEHLGWKPTTTYTVIKRLSERGVLKNENTVVTSLISQDEAQTAEIDELLDKRFDGRVRRRVYQVEPRERQGARRGAENDRPLSKGESSWMTSF